MSLPDMNECELGYCGDNGVCYNSVGSFNCTCYDGFDFVNSSNLCEGLCINHLHPIASMLALALLYYADIDECEMSPCGDNEECSNDIGNFSCSCESGYSKNFDYSEGCTGLISIK